MKQAVYLIIWMGMLLVGSSCSHKAEKDMPMRTISVTVEPLRYFTEVIAGDKFKVVSMVPKGSSPETYDPTPQQLVSLGGSDAYMSESVDLIREEEPDHGDHRHEGGVEPHIWNSTQNAHIIADNIYKALCELDTVNISYYAHRRDSLHDLINQTDTQIRDLLTDADRSFMIYHPALSYFARDYGLHQISIEKGGKEPSPAHLKELIDTCKAENVHVIFVQPEFDRRNAEIIAEQTNTRIVPINPLSYNWVEEMLVVARTLNNPE